MPFLFCQQCGTKNTYESARPNFCMSCGTSFGSMSAPAENNTPKEDQPTEVQETPNFNIQKLEFEIINNNVEQTTLGSVMKEEKIGLMPRKKRKSKTGDPIQDSMDLCKPVKEPIDIEQK